MVLLCLLLTLGCAADDTWELLQQGRPGQQPPAFFWLRAALLGSESWCRLAQGLAEHDQAASTIPVTSQPF